MKIGIISRCKGEKKGILSFFKRKRAKNCFIKGFEVKQIVLKGKITDRKIQKACKKLESFGADFILKENSLKSDEEKKELVIYENRFFLNLAFELYKEYIRCLFLKAYKMKVVLIDKKLYGIDFEFIERMCFYASKCDIITDKKDKAEAISERIFKQSGFFVSVYENVQSGCDAVFDVDKKTLKITGRVFISHIEFGLDEFFKFDINMIELIKNFESHGFKIQYKKTEGSRAYFEVK